MTEIFTTFAANGDPNNQELHVEWKPIESSSSPLECMNISHDQIKSIPLPEGERLKTWSEIFAREKIDTV